MLWCANQSMATRLFWCLLVGTIASGCARPEGTLFPALQSPRVWPAPPQQSRIAYIGAISDSNDLHASQSGWEMFQAGLRGPLPPIRFSGPHALAMGPDGWLAVADTSAAAVHLININTRDHRIIAGWHDERFASPVGVTWVNHRLFVTDAQRHEVIEMDTTGTVHRHFGTEDLQRPVGITFAHANQRLYVVDGDAHRIAVFNMEGKLEKFVGQRGTAPGEFNYPSHITSTADKLLIADSGNFRVQLIDLDGNGLRVFGQKGDGAGDFSLPKGVAVDSDGHIYVVDAHFENVQIFNQQGQLLLSWGQEGSGIGAFILPAGIAIDSLDRIWIADAGNRRIQVFQYMKAKS